MAAYIIARLEVEDVSLLKDYLVTTPPIVKKYRGRFIARGGSTVTLEGPEETRRIVLIEFPALSDAEAFYHSPEYSQARKLREGVTVAEFIVVDGVPETDGINASRSSTRQEKNPLGFPPVALRRSIR